MSEAGRIKVLHIDDDESFLELFRNTYHEEFDIVSLPGGNDVPDIVEREAPGALVLDYELPGRNGLELLSAIKEKYPSLPVIFYTGQGNEEIARQAFREGATDYFVKKSADFAQKEKVVNSIQKAVANRAVEDELAEKQAMLEGIIEYNPYSIQIADSKGWYIRSNKAHTKIFGISPGADGKIIFDEALSIPDEVKEAIQKECDTKRNTYSLFEDENALKDDETKRLATLWQKGEVVKLPPILYKHPFPLVGSSMKPVCVAGTGFSIKDSHGDIISYIQMHEDITARVKTEEALKKAHEELKNAYESVERKVVERTAELADANTRLQDEIDERVRLQDQLERQNSELEGFSRTVSHDLRNNLNALQRLMERGTMAQEDAERTQKLLIENTSHLQRFVERLLFLAQAGKSISEKRKVSLDDIARKAFALAAASQGKAAASPGEAELSVIQPFPPVLCDPGAFEQIFSNLFNNALAHAQPESKPVIKVGCEVYDGTAVITVSDNGKGIDPGIASKIFDSTFTTNRKEHFGLGLAIVKKLVEAHGGSVRAESVGPGKGASFVMTIPNRP